ncbi:MAG: nucleotidyltransferase domain-containing protein [archaeon]
MKKTNIKQRILKQIKQVEKEKDVKVLFLIESGSRAWRWESEDSDYDVRGVYVQDYLKVEDPKEQIELIEGELDIVLWGFKKFLRLMKKSNPSVWEWLSSDIIYIDSEIRKNLKFLFKENFNEYSLKQHYISMARQNFEKYINNSKDKANLKKYVYVLRSVACVLWIDKHKSPPPKDYREVVGFLPKHVQKFFNKIVKDKKKSEDLMGPRNKQVDKYISGFFSKKFPNQGSSFDEEEIDKIFKKYVWGSGR